MRFVGVISPPYSNKFAGRAKNEEEYKRRDYLAIEKHNWNWYGANEANIGNLIDELTETETFDITRFCHCSELYWIGCYGSDVKYKKYVTAESYRHPAKASFQLVNRIYDHLEVLGLLKKEDVVVDFMSGTGRINLLAALRGYKTVSIELEKHFCDMIEGNKAKLFDVGQFCQCDEDEEQEVLRRLNGNLP